MVFSSLYEAGISRNYNRRALIRRCGRRQAKQLAPVKIRLKAAVGLALSGCNLQAWAGGPSA